MCTQSLFFSTLPSIIRLARELRDSDAREESAVIELRETLLSASAMMSDKAGKPFLHGDPLSLHIAGEPVHLDSEDSARLTGGLLLLLIVAGLPGAAPSGTVQDAMELLAGVAQAHNRRCPPESLRDDVFALGRDGEVVRIPPVPPAAVRCECGRPRDGGCTRERCACGRA